ncbi:MAG TPA: hypothetical protein VH165_09620 [Kofleriaceae bacterium]|jgi:hypothetical protein|nr:hypothetical protein [Kofleriaceae bacterium]
MKMTCQRALETLASLASHKPAFTADEIEELLKLGLALEADPRDLATLAWLQPAVTDHAGGTIDDPDAVPKLTKQLAEVDEQLRSDWFRFTHGKDKIANREQDRQLLRRTLAVLNNPLERDRLVKLALERWNNNDPTYAACEPLGSEVYALSSKGTRVGHDLQLRIARFADQPLGVFMKAFDKADTKMAAFSTDIATLSNNIGPVRKNAHQVVIGLAKTGMPPAQALGVYHDAMRGTGQPDVAVTCARNAAEQGSPQQVAARLKEAQHALARAGIPMTDVARGAAKSLLPFEPLAAGAARFVAIAQLLENQNLTRGDLTFKSAARLMPVDGEPGALVRRALIAYNALPDRDRDTRTSTAVALASMVRGDDAIAETVARFLALHDELVRRRISPPEHATGDALECVACSGTPVEVVETVRQLLEKLTQNRSPERGDVAIAVSFAKRFAY